MFQEGNDPVARKAFQLLALKSGGRYFKFNAKTSRAVEQLSNQLNAIARLAVGDTDVRSLGIYPDQKQATDAVAKAAGGAA